MQITEMNPQEFGLEPKKATELLADLPQIVAERKALEEQYNEVIRLNIEDEKTAKAAKALRLKIRDNRTKGIEPWHKTNKDLFLKAGQFLDAIKRKEVEVNKRMEDALEQIEKYKELKEQKRIADLRNFRLHDIQEYAEFVPSGLDLGTLSIEEYEKVFNGAKLQYEAKLKAEKEEEEQRVAAEQRAERFKLRERALLSIAGVYVDVTDSYCLDNKGNADFSNLLEADTLDGCDDAKFRAYLEEFKATAAANAEYDAAIKAENERLKAEADAKQRAADAALAEERRKQAALQAELKAKQDAEDKAERERLAEEQRKQKEAEAMAKAPVKTQLQAWVDSFSITDAPVSNAVSEDIQAKFKGFKAWATKCIAEL